MHAIAKALNIVYFPTVKVIETHSCAQWYEQELGFCRAIRHSIGTSCNWTFRPQRPSSTVKPSALTYYSIWLLTCCMYLPFM